MKRNRQEKLLELISRYEIETQEDLIERLRESGYNATQATISRDIRELQIAKMTTGRGTYRYVLPKDRFAVGANLSYSLMTRTPQKKNDSASGGSGTDGSSASTGTADDGSKTTSLSDRKTTHHLLFVTTGATCYYKRSGWCKLYGALDLGVVYSYNLAELSPVFKNQCGFVLNVVPIGVQMGNDRVSGFCDLSFGYKGFVNLGVRFSL